MSKPTDSSGTEPKPRSTFVAVQNLLRRFYQETGDIPYAITLPPTLFAACWKDVRVVANYEYPGFFTEGGPPIDAGNPVIEMHADGGIVRVRCSDPIYQKDLGEWPSSSGEPEKP